MIQLTKLMELQPRYLKEMENPDKRGEKSKMHFCFNKKVAKREMVAIPEISPSVNVLLYI